MNKVKVDASGKLKVKLGEIWCLFSIANDYDQPNDNLVMWWTNEPTFEQLARAVGIKYSKEKGNKYLAQILKGHELQLSEYGDYTTYRLRKVKENSYIIDEVK